MARRNYYEIDGDNIIGLLIIGLIITIIQKFWLFLLIGAVLFGIFLLVRYILDLDLKSKNKKPILYYKGKSGHKTLEMLEELNNNEYKINCMKRGLYGEENLLYTLSQIQIPMYVLYDLNLKLDGYESQIDFIIVTKRNIYVLESKNLKGNIDIEEKGLFTRKNRWGKSSIKNPLTQNIEHENVLNAIFKEEKIKRNFQSLVVLTNDSSYINFKKNAKHLQNKILRNDQVNTFLESNEKKSHVIRDEKKVINICNYILKYNDVNKYFGKEESLDVDDNIKNNVLIEKLRMYRRNKAKEENIEPYMIFNDQTLNEINKKLPKTLEELNKIYGFGDIKIQKYGYEILDIIEISRTK